MNDTQSKPRWLHDLCRFLPLKSQFVLSGNVADLQVCEIAAGTSAALPLEGVIERELTRLGYAGCLVYDPIGGFRQAALAREPGALQSIMDELGLARAEGASPAGLTALSEAMERFVAWSGDPLCLIVDYSSQLTVQRDALSASEHWLFTRALVLSRQAAPRPVGDQGEPFFNTLIWITQRETDLPDWFLIDNPRTRSISIALPDHHARRALVPTLLASVERSAGASEDAIRAAETRFVEETEGLRISDLNAIAQLARRERVPVEKIEDAIRRYKVGVTYDPWARIDRAKIRDGAAFIRRRLKGQEHAISHALDIVKRAMTGVGQRGRRGRPRGVTFLAGPTGVGKTELAKTLTSLLFGDDRASIRFDMSEFSAEHADQRLIGAPPGYIGYDAGGELTNAIRERPFSVVLFDEIEKAHPRILDKFLQILDDGVLTSGRGDRVYFSEAFIVFTSNLGIYRQDDTGRRVLNVSPEQAFEDVEHHVRSEIENHFKLVLNRPEILNRIGENIIVFDFIRPGVAGEIFDHMVDATLADLHDQGYRITLSEQARRTLRAVCTRDLSHGGRGIRNQVEVHLVNPLSRTLFDRDIGRGEPLHVADVTLGTITALVVAEPGS